MSSVGEQVSLEDAVTPMWLRGYTDPVVRVPGSSTKKFHKPDEDAEEPAPACKYSTSGHDYDVKERAVLEGFWDECTSCYGGPN